MASATISALQSPILTPSQFETAGEPDALASTEHDDGALSDGELASGAVTPTKTPDSATTPTGTARKSRGFLDLTPLSGFFKRNPSSSRGAARAEPPLDSDEHSAGEATPTVASMRAPAGLAASVSAPELSAAEAQAEGSASGGEDEAEDESDRRTIRASTSEDGLDEAKRRAKVHAAPSVNGNGHAAGEVGEKVVELAPEGAVHAPGVVVDGVS